MIDEHSHNSQKQRRAVLIKKYFNTLKSMEFAHIVHFITTTFSSPNIKYLTWLWSHRMDLGYEKSNYFGMTCQQSSGGPVLEKTFSMIPINPTDAIIDIGSGKAGAIMTLCQYSFGKVDGIEIDKTSYKTATTNLSKTRYKKATLYLGDARTFTKYDDYNFIYMFNPFNEQIMEEFLNQIRKSLASKPRKLVMVYYNPLCHETVTKSKIFIKYIDPNIPSIFVKIYTNDRDFKLKGQK